MADTKTSDEAAAAALDGTELVRAVQSGGMVQTTAAAIARSGRSGALVYLTADLTSQNFASFPAISWTAAKFDTDSYWSAGSPTRLTAPANGWYEARGNVQINLGTADEYIRASIQRNGANFTGNPYAFVEVGSVAPAINLSSGAFQMTAGQYIEMIFDTEADTSITLVGVDNVGSTWLQLMRVA